MIDLDTSLEISKQFQTWCRENGKSQQGGKGSNYHAIQEAFGAGWLACRNSQSESQKTDTQQTKVLIVGAWKRVPRNLWLSHERRVLPVLFAGFPTTKTICRTLYKGAT